jgi:two-component system OmpR family sensor kinase
VNSLIAKVKILGVFTSILLAIMVYLAFEYSLNYAKGKEIVSASLLYKVLKKEDSKQKIQDYLNTHHLEAINAKNTKEIIAKAEHLIKTPIYRDIFQSGDITLYIYKEYYYYHVYVHQQSYLFKNRIISVNYMVYILFSTLVMALFFLGLYLYIFKAIKPLKTLHKKIHAYANPQIHASTKYLTKRKKDEVFELAYEFDKAMIRIQTLQNNRTLFWRNVMHELKTPLTQGMLLVHTLEDSSQNKENLNKVFKKMQEQLDKLKQLEYIKSDTLTLHLQKVNMIDIIDDVKDMLFINDNSISYTPIMQTFTVDIELFMVAVKNLISNAITYSPDNHVTIKHKKNHLYISNKGKPLNNPFQTYTEAFVRGESNKSGMGLGLYISKEILAKHDIKLVYKYMFETHFMILRF